MIRRSPDARRHVNKMCMAANVPLVESGTAGYLGQVQPLLKVRGVLSFCTTTASQLLPNQDRTECFDCIPKPTPKTFPVCTIRSTPSQPIHCIVWSKSYLMGCVTAVSTPRRFSDSNIFQGSYSGKTKMLLRSSTMQRNREKMVRIYAVVFQPNAKHKPLS